jgi:hypothetical protein
MTTDSNTSTLTLHVYGITKGVADAQKLPILMTGVVVRLIPQEDAAQALPAAKVPGERRGVSGGDGRISFSDVPPGPYTYLAVGAPYNRHRITLEAGDHLVRELDVPVDFKLVLPDGESDHLSLDTVIPYGRNVRLRTTWTDADEQYFDLPPGGTTKVASGILTRGMSADALPVSTVNPRQQDYFLHAGQAGNASMLAYFGPVTGRFPPGGPVTLSTRIPPSEPMPIEGSINVGMRRAPSSFTDDVPFWVSIRKSTEALSFDRYFDFMNWLFCDDPKGDPLDTPSGSHANMFNRANRRRLPFVDTDAYRNIKVATEAFVMANCGIYRNFTPDDAQYVVDRVGVPTDKDKLETRFRQDYLETLTGAEAGVLPYLAIIRRKLSDQRIKQVDIGDVMLQLDRPAVDACYGLLRQKLTCPCLLELIWSYWQEEGMLVQTMNALARRFQNMRSPTGNDPLANLEIDPLRPLNNVVWGYIQDEQHRLSVVRRNYEYDHHYGLRLAGRAVQAVRTADSRSKFLEAFHALLSITSAFYKRDDDTTILADGFPVLNALKEAHLILSQGAHNQFGDLPSTARIEMLMQQWILARPEFREFLPTRIMAAYPEPWMDRVDAMKKLQGWTDTSVLHFRNLALFGEPVLLAIRYGAWAEVNDPVQATNWARYWRPEIQGYMHAYRSVTGVDLTVDVTNARIDSTMPSVHLVQRLSEQRRIA